MKNWFCGFKNSFVVVIFIYICNVFSYEINLCFYKKYFIEMNLKLIYLICDKCVNYNNWLLLILECDIKFIF